MRRCTWVLLVAAASRLFEGSSNAAPAVRASRVHGLDKVAIE